MCLVKRYEKKLTEDGKKTPKVLPFTPAHRGGWWVTNPMNTSLPDEDKRIKQYPIYRLPDFLKAQKDRQVWIVEGEKCVDAVLDAVGIPNNSPPPCTTLMGSKKDVSNVDLIPLEGRQVLLIADTDEPSRAYMKRLGTHLHENQGCGVRYVLPPGVGGYDVADVLAEGGWPALTAWLKKIGPEPHKKVAVHGKDKVAPILPLSDTEYFRVVGISEGDQLLILNKTTQEIHKLRRNSVFNEGNLITLAPLQWWMDKCAGSAFSSAKRTAFGDAIIRAAEAKGFIDIDRTAIGRGAHYADGSYYYNLGNRLLCQDKHGMMSVEKTLSDAPEDVIFRPGKAISVHHNAQVQSWTRAMYDAVLAYRWASPMEGRAFLGWIVTSLVGGALPFRPMIWLLAPGGTGKTFLLSKVMARVLGNTASTLASTTEAGLMALMVSDSLPCLIDEFEPAEAKIQTWQSILDLIRMSSGGDMGRAKGTADGGVRLYRPRFSVLVSSVDKPKMSDADSQRFYQISLGDEVPNWPMVEAGILDSLSSDKSLAIRSHIIRSLSEIVTQAREIEGSLIKFENMSTRMAQMVGALTAGAGFLSGDMTPIFTNREIKRVNPADVREETVDLLQELLGQMVMSGEKSHHVTLAECLQKEYKTTASRYGFKLNRGDDDQRELWCALNHPPMSALLMRTKYASTDLNYYLCGLPGAARSKTLSGAPKRIYFSGVQRSVVVLPPPVLVALGIDEEPEYEMEG